MDFEDWSDYAGMPYFGAVTGDDNKLGINGALMQRQSPPPEPNQALNGYACTMGVEDYDSTEAKILHNGGKVALPKYALPGMAWQGYFRIQKEIYLAFINQMRMPNRMFSL